MKVGDVITWQKVFSVEEVLTFGQLSGDQGRQHMELDSKGRLMVQGLLTASLPTKIGGDLNYIARQMVFNFVRPVYTGDVIICNVHLDQIAETDKGTLLKASWECFNQYNRIVLTGDSEGIIPA